MGRLFADCITIMLPLVVQATPVRLKVAMPGIQSTDSLILWGEPKWTDIGATTSLRAAPDRELSLPPSAFFTQSQKILHGPGEDFIPSVYQGEGPGEGWIFQMDLTDPLAV